MKCVAEQPQIMSHGKALRRPSTCCRFLAIGGLCVSLALGAASLSWGAARPVVRESDFDRANALYEKGDYTNAATFYKILIEQSPDTPTLYFNLGNAWFKAGALGRAIAAYRQGERLNPRDPSLRFNLNYTRKQILGEDAKGARLWERLLAQLTLNEWTCLAAGLLWLLFLLLALREARARWRQPLLPYVWASGMGFLLCASALVLVLYVRDKTRPAVVVVPEAVVRYGPLAESQVSHQLRDGSEIEVVDEKKVSLGNGEQVWWQVRDRAGRVGWLRSEQALRIW